MCHGRSRPSGGRGAEGVGRRPGATLATHKNLHPPSTIAITTVTSTFAPTAISSSAAPTATLATASVAATTITAASIAAPPHARTVYSEKVEQPMKW